MTTKERLMAINSTFLQLEVGWEQYRTARIALVHLTWLLVKFFCLQPNQRGHPMYIMPLQMYKEKCYMIRERMMVSTETTLQEVMMNDKAQGFYLFSVASPWPSRQALIKTVFLLREGGHARTIL
jgi:hypothetical protein